MTSALHRSSSGTFFLRIFLAFWVMLLGATFATAATRIVRVKTGAPINGANGNSWATAYPNLSQAITAANALAPTSNDPVQLWISVGTYKPDAPQADPEHGVFSVSARDGTFLIKSYVSLYGGFVGTETDLGQRTFSDTAPLTILSGDIGSVYLANEAAPTTRAQALLATVRNPEDSNFADNVTNVVTIIDGVGVNLNNLLITGGFAKNLATVPYPDVLEMAMPDSTNETTLGSKRKITREAAGGGIYIESSTLPSNTAVNITNCIFAQNHAFGFGGALSIIRSRVYSASNLYVANSAGDSGGAAFGRAQFSLFENDVMLRNLSQGNGGAVHLNTPPVRPSNWANSYARSLFGGDSKFAIDTIGNQINVAAMFPGVVAPRAGLLSLEGAAALSTKLGTVAAGSVASNFLSISTGPLKYVTAAIDITDLIVNELRVQGVNGAFIDFWTQSFMPQFSAIGTPQGWVKTYKHAFYDDAKFDENTQEWQVKQAYQIFYNPAEPTRFNGVRFDNNTAYGDGGAIFALHANYHIDRSLFSENVAERSGGALAARAFNKCEIVSSVFSANTSPGHSAICLSQSARVRLLNCTIVNNTSSTAGAALGVELGSESRVLNTVLWGNTSTKLPAGGADIYTSRAQDLDSSTRKVYDTARPHRFTFVGWTDIVGSDVQGLADLDNSWGVGDIRYLSGSNLSPADISIAQQMRDLADYASATDEFQLTVMGEGNRYLSDRGNFSVNPQLHDGWLPSANSPLINAGRRDVYGFSGLSPLGPYTVDFIGQPRAQDYTSISIGAVQLPSDSTNGATAEAVGRYFVTPTGAGDKSGRNWANASDDLKTIIAQPNVEVWVKAGSYYPSKTGDRFASFTLGKGTRIYGGFVGTETVFADRNPGTNLTSLSGSLGDVFAGATGNSYHVVKQENTQETQLIDGFRILGGRANGSGENANGAGVYASNVDLTIRRTIFSDNSATGSGGGIYTSGQKQLQLYDCYFDFNSARDGAGLYARSPLLVDRTSFFNGTATQTGGGVTAVSNSDNGNTADQRVVFQNTVFAHNRTTNTGHGSAIYISEILQNEIRNCTISQNAGYITPNTGSYLDPFTQHFGTAVYFDQTSGLIVNSILWDNAPGEFLASTLPRELANFYANAEESFGIILSHSVIQGYGMKNPVLGFARSEGTLADQYITQGNVKVRKPDASNSIVDSCYDETPGFTNPSQDNYRLYSGSNFINHGDNDATKEYNTDRDGLPRKDGGYVDIGAYEYQGPTTSIFSVVTASRVITADGPVFTIMFHPENPVGSDATYLWMVNKNDGRGFVALPEDSRLTGQGTDHLTLNQPPYAWDKWVFRVTVSGANTATASTILKTTGSARFYVNGAVTASGDGRTWATAFKTVREATVAAGDEFRAAFGVADPYVQVWVAQGTYRPEKSNPRGVLTLYSGMVLYGGFKGDETSASQRNPVLYPTIIDGAQPDAKEDSDYANSIFSLAPAGALPIGIDGVTIRSSDSESISISGVFGGNGSGAPVNITNCIIENERARGVLTSRDVNFKNVIFRKNNASAVYVSGGNATFENCLFTQNSGATGAAMLIYGGNVLVRATTIVDNFGTQNSGGIYLGDAGATLTLDRSILWNNRDNPSEIGGSLEKAQLIKSAGTLTVTNSLIEGMTSYSTGGNLALHPLFNDPLNFNYTLAPQSPAIALNAGAYPYVGTADTTLRFTTIPASTEERTSLFSKEFLITWPTDAAHVLHWEVNRGNGWVAASSANLNAAASNSATSAFLSLSSTDILPTLRVRAVTANNVALPAITLKVIPPIVRRVKADATGTADGLTWATAYRSIDAAVANLTSNNVEIWVAKGTHALTNNQLSAIPGVTYFGGFAGNETSLNQRVLSAANQTTLSGTLLIMGQDFFVAGAKLDARYVGRQLVADGFRLTGGLYGTAGAGIVRNVEFAPTGSVNMKNISTVFENCTFTNFTGQGDGLSPVVEIYRGSPIFRSCIFRDNVITAGDGTAIRSTLGDVLVDRCIFQNNRTKSGDGGAISNSGGSFTITNSLFVGNTADRGGAFSGTNFRIVNCTVTNNRAVRLGGGLYSRDANTITNSIFWGNTAVPTTYGDPAVTEKAQINPASGTLSVENSIVEGLKNLAGNNNLPYNPLFSGDLFSPYALSANSPAINSAVLDRLDSIAPVAGYPGRLSGGALDMGAYEFFGTVKTPILLTSAPTATTALYTGASASFNVSGGAGTGANVAWERSVNGQWVIVSGTGFSIATTSTGSTLSLTGALVSQAGLYRYRIASLGFTSPTFTVNITARRVVYVDANAPAGGNGSSWGTAFQSPGAINSLTDPGLEVRIAAGTYNNPAIALRPGLYFRGGFPATGTATQRNVADPGVNVTEFRGTNIATAIGTEVVFDSSTGYEGITFREGNSAQQYQRGVIVFYRNCVIRDIAGGVGGFSGAIMLDYASQALFEDCSFISNIGPAVNTSNYSSARIVRGTFSNNNGSVLAVSIWGSFTVEDSLFSNNALQSDRYLINTSIDGRGDNSQVSTITRSRFIGNSGGTLIRVSNQALIVTDTLFANNTAPLAQIGANTIFRHVTAVDNVVSALRDGPSVTARPLITQILGQPFEVSNSIFWANRVEASGNSVEAQQIERRGDGLVFNNNIIEGFETFGGTGNTGYNPLFVDQSTQNYRLSPYSPAIASGATATTTLFDLGLVTRSGTPDLGAYDFTGTAQTPVRLTSAPVSISTFLRNTGSLSVTGTPGANITWLRWNGTAFVPVDLSDTRLTITNTATGSTLSLSNVATTDTAGFAYRIGTYTSSIILIKPTVRPRVYVDAASPAGNTATGATWALAYRNLDYAYQYAPDYAEIWVKTGNYSSFLTLRPGIEVYGGFTTNATDVTQRDLTGTNTVLTGQIKGTAATPGAVLDGLTLTGNSKVLYLYGPANPTLRRCVIRNAGESGVDLSGAASAVFEDCKFFANAKGSIVISGGNATVLRGDFTGNGKAIVSNGGKLTVTDSLFHDNLLGANNLVSVGLPGEVVLDRCTIRDNTGESLLTAYDGKLTVRNSLIVDNNSNYEGVLNARNMSGRIGELEVIQSTIYGNESINGTGGIYAVGGTVSVKNSIVWGNRGRAAGSTLNIEQQQIFRTSGTFTLLNSMVESFATLGGTGNVADAPLFTDAGSDNFTLSAISPAINAGSATVDQTGFALDRAANARVTGAAPDMGAYEFTGTPGTPLRIVRSPSSLDVETGGTATFLAESATSGTFTWQFESSPGVWTTLTNGVNGYTITVSGNTSTLSFAGSAGNNGARFRYLFGAVASSSFGLNVVSRRTIYVDATATGTANGTSWTTAFRTIQDAINAWSVGAEIWVSRKAITVTEPLVLKEGLRIYGGFAGNEVTREQRAAGIQTALQNTQSGYVIDQSATPVTAATVFDGFNILSQRLRQTGIILVNSSPVIQNCTFSGFTGEIIRNTGGTPQILNCVFVNNLSNAITDINGNSQIRFCDFNGNTSDSYGYAGSAIRSQGNLGSGTTVVTDSVFRNTKNTAVYVMDNARVAFDRCRWTGNTGNYATVMNVQAGSTVAVRNTLITDNAAPFLHDNNNSALINNSGTLTLINVTVANNTAPSFGGTIRQGSILYTTGTLTVTNSIFTDNTITGNTTGLTAEQKQIYRGNANMPTISSSLIAGLSAYANFTNIGFAPNFDPAYPGEYRLSIYSPAVDAGSSSEVVAPNTDVSGNPRIVGSAVDMGARELNETIGVTPLQVQVDANSGNVVPVWSTAAGQLVIQGSIDVTSGIYWETQINGQWVAIPAGGAFSASFNSYSATLTIAAPASDDIADRLVRFGINGTSYLSPTYTITTSRSNIRYVSAFATAGGDGLNWNTAYQTLAEAIAKAPTHAEIWVAGGTYTDTASLVLRGDLRIYGGFNGYGREAARTERNPAKNPVKLANSFNIGGVPSTDTPVIDGVQMIGGSVTLANRGAIFRNVRFENGGAINASSYAPSLLLEDCTFVNKDVAVAGFIDALTVRRTTFTGNEQALVAFGGLTWLIEDSKFDASVDRTGTGNPHYLRASVPNLTVRRTTFSNAAGRSAAITLTQSGSTTVNAVFTDCVFSGNRNVANGAGIISATGLTLTMDRCTIIDNRADIASNAANAGALSIQAGANVTIRNTYIAGNVTKSTDLPSPFRPYGAIYVYNSTLNLTGVTLVNNSATAQSLGGISLDNSSATITNSILYGNNAASGTVEHRQLQLFGNSTITLKNTLLEGLDTFTGTALSSSNPRFITVNNRLVPGLDSPARNIGDNTALVTGETDLFGNARINQDTVDLGAVEATTSATPAVLDLAVTRTVAGGYLEITFENSRNYPGLVWQINTGSGWVNLTVPADADITNGNLRTLRLPWSPELYQGAQLRLLGTNYTSTSYVIAFGAPPNVVGAITSITPASGSTANSARPAITVTFDQAQNGLTLSNLVVHGSLHGRLASAGTWGSVTTDIQAPTLTPGITFNAGEIVDVSATSAITTKVSNGGVKPYVSRFMAPWVSRPGKFRQSDVLATTGNVTGAAAGDINGDGFGDVMFTGDDGAWIYLGDLDGNFTRLQYGAGGGWNGFALADFNGDGRVDFVGSRNKSSLTVETLDAATVSTTNLLTTPLAYAGSRLLTGDFNGDGRQDILVLGASNTDGEVLLLNNGNGTFSPAGTQRFAPSTDRTREAAVADVNHDGALDFVQVRATTGDIFVWLNDGTGNFSADTSVRVTGTQTIALTDIDRDGWTDLVVAGGAGTDTLHVYRNDQAGHFVFQRAVAAGKVVQLAAADFDGDGDNDLVAITGAAADTLWTNNGSGVFTATTLPWTSLNASANAQLAVADLNHDGAADIAIPQSSRISFWTPGNYFVGFTKTLAEATTLTFAESDFTAATTDNVNRPLVYETDHYVIVSLPSHGSLKVNGSALSVGQKISFHSNVASTYTYTPTGHYYGADSFVVAPGDYLYRSPGARVKLNITRVVDAPAGGTVVLKTFKNQNRTVTLTGTHPENEQITYTLLAPPAHGTVTLTGNQATYVPATNYVGSDAFTYTLSDAFGNTATGTVNATVSDASATVTSNAGSGPGSLAAAIATIKASGGGRVLFDAALDGQTLVFETATDTLHGPSAVLVDGYLEIDGSATPNLKIYRNFATTPLRFFRVTSTGHLVLRNVKFFDGRATNESASLPARGGAIYNEGEIELSNVTFKDNLAESLAGTGAEGGIIYSSGGKLTALDADFYDSEARNGSGGALFLRNGSASFESSNFISNVAPITGANVHVIGDNAAATTTWTTTYLTAVSVAKVGTGTVSTWDKNNHLTPVSSTALNLSRVQIGQIFDTFTKDVTVSSPTAALTISHYDNTFYRGTGDVPVVEITPNTGTTRTLRFLPAEDTGGVTNYVLTATEDGISYSLEFSLGFLTLPYTAPTVADTDVYVIDQVSQPFTLTGSHELYPVTIQLLSLPTHGTLVPGATNKDYTYVPTPGYQGDDYLIYRVDTQQNRPASARVTFRNVSAHRVVTNADSNGPGSLADILTHAPAIDYHVSFDASLANKTITLPSTPLDTPAGPSAFFIGGTVELDGVNAPGLKIVRADTAPAMRLFYVAPTGLLTLKNITLGNGLAAGASGQPGRGGAVYVDRDAISNLSGTALFQNVILENNVAFGGTGANGEGGAIYSANGLLNFENVSLNNNSALGGTGGTGFGGALYLLSGQTRFGGNNGQITSSLSGNIATNGDDIAVIADGDIVTRDVHNPDGITNLILFKTNTAGLFTSSVHNGKLEVTAYQSAVSGPNALSIAPLPLVQSSLTRDLPLTLANGPLDSLAINVVSSYSNFDLSMISNVGTLAAPVLRVTAEGFDEGALISLSAVRGNITFKREIALDTSGYFTPEPSFDQEFTMGMNEPLSFTLDGRYTALALTYQVFDPQIPGSTPELAGSLSGTAPNLTFTPPQNFIGDVEFYYIVTDERGGEGVGHVTFHIDTALPTANDLPTAEAQSGNGTVASPITLTGTGSAITFEIVTQPTHGTITAWDGTGHFNYTPAAGFLTAEHSADPDYGYDMFTFRTVDQFGRPSDPAIVYIDILDIASQLPPVVTGVPAAPGVLLVSNQNMGEPNKVFSTITITDPDSAELWVTLPLFNEHGYMDADVNNGWTRVYDDQLGDIFVTSGTPADVTARLRAVTYYASLPNEARGTLLDASTYFDLSDGRTYSHNVVPVRGLRGYEPARSDPVVRHLFTPSATPISFTVVMAQAQNQPITISDFVLELTVPNGTETPDYVSIPANSAYGTLTGGPTDPAQIFHSGDVLNYTFTPAANFNGQIFAGWDFHTDLAEGDGGSAVFITINNPPVGVDDLVTRGANAKVITTASLLANDTDPDFVAGDTLSFVSIPATSVNGVALTRSGGNITYAASESTEDDSFVYTLKDARGSTATATVHLLYANTAPVAVTDIIELPYGQSSFQITAGMLLANDTDAEGDFVTLESVSATSTDGSSLSLVDGVITYTLANPATTTAASFTYTIRDVRSSNSATAIGTVHVLIGNRPPVAGNVELTRYNDQVATVTTETLLATSHDADGDALSFVSVESTSALGATLTKTGETITYTASSQTAISDEDYFLYTVQDARGGTATGIVTVKLLNRNPVGAAHTIGRFNTDPVTIIPVATLLAGASDADLDTITFAGVNSVSAHGATITIVGSNAVYTPPSVPFNTEDTFTYTVKDSKDATGTGLVTMKLVNRAPTPASDSFGRYNTEAGTITTASLLANDTDPDGDVLTFVSAATTSAQGAIITVNAGVVTYTAASPTAITGDDTFTYTIKDSHDVTATASVTVQLINRAPVAVADTINRYNTEPGTITTASLLANDSDPDLDALTFVSASTTSAQGAIITVNAGVVTYTAASATAIVGDDTFTYTIKDTHDVTATTTVTVHLVNRPPVAVADTVTRPAGQPLTIPHSTLLGNDSDPDGDVITVVTVTTSAQGVPVLIAGNTITYIPAAAINGDDTFTYTIKDAHDATATATVTVHTLAPPTPPVLTIAHRTGGGASLTLKGVAFTRYVISVSTDLTGWSALTTVTTDAQGLATAEDANAPTDGAGRFYQADSTN